MQWKHCVELARTGALKVERDRIDVPLVLVGVPLILLPSDFAAKSAGRICR